MFLLDTNMISELRKAGDGNADANIIARLSRVDATIFYHSAIALMELELAQQIERRDTTRGPGSAPGWTILSSRNFRNGPWPVDMTVAFRY